MIFQHITLFLVSQATSKVIRKCLINLWSTWHKCIIDTTSIHCFLIYLIHVLDIKCCHTGYVKAMLSKNIFISQGPFCTSHLKFCTPLANFRPVGSFARFAIFVIIDPLFRTSLATSSRKFAKHMAHCLPDWLLRKGQLIASWANYPQIRHFCLVRHFVKFPTFQGASFGIQLEYFLKPMVDFSRFTVFVKFAIQ